jgi:N-methylhydantoinase A
MDAGHLHDVFIQQENQGRAIIDKEPIDIDEMSISRSLDMQFVGQTHILNVNLDHMDLPASQDDIQDLFEQVYFNRFRVKLDKINANIVNVNTSVIGKRKAFDLSQLIESDGRKSSLADARIGTRQVHVAGQFVDTPVYQRESLPLDVSLNGPAMIQQMDTTILVEPGDRVSSDAQGNLFIHVGKGAE